MKLCILNSLKILQVGRYQTVSVLDFIGAKGSFKVKNTLSHVSMLHIHSAILV